MNKTVGEFFAGIGLMRLGLEKAGWSVVWANDIDENKLKMYRGHFREGNDHFVLGDVHTIRGDDLPNLALVTASFPCNDLSLAGGRSGLAGKNSSAFWGFINVISDMKARRPPMVLLENVPGFLTSHDGRDFADACIALNELDYAVDALLIDAVHFVPQSRQRLFVIGTRQRASTAIKDTLSFFEGYGRPAVLANFILHHPEINWSIRELPRLPQKGRHLSDVIEELPLDSEFWWSKDRVEYLLSQMSDKHHAEAERMIHAKAVSCGTVFRRVRHGRSMAELRTDGVAGCLRTPRGGSGRQILFLAGRGQCSVRLLTPKECARLMGAGGYRIGPEITLNQALFGFGDAVCVPVVQWIAENYLNPVWEELYGAQEEFFVNSTPVQHGVR